LAYRQAQETGGHVRAGERGNKVYFVKQLQVDDNSETETEPRLILEEIQQLRD
jgi:antirestriction protein ArdC